MKGFRKSLIVVLLIGLCNVAQAIVNIETLRSRKGTGTQHETELKANGATGNSENFRAGAAHATAWKWSQSQSFVILDYNYGESREIKDTNKFFAHIRHAHDTSIEKLQWEIFSQWQYNEFQRLNSRFLAGSGVRYGLYEGGEWSIYSGAGAFWYKEDISSQDQLMSEKEEGGRGNFYLASKWKLDERFFIFNTIYFQPHMQRMKDHNVLWDLQGKFAINGLLSLTLNLTVTHDNNPPQGIKNTDTAYLVGLKFSY